jgi:hypothetical protein
LEVIEDMAENRYCVNVTVSVRYQTWPVAASCPKNSKNFLTGVTRPLVWMVASMAPLAGMLAVPKNPTIWL